MKDSLTIINIPTLISPLIAVRYKIVILTVILSSQVLVIFLFFYFIRNNKIFHINNK